MPQNPGFRSERAHASHAQSASAAAPTRPAASPAFGPRTCVAPRQPEPVGGRRGSVAGLLCRGALSRGSVATYLCFSLCQFFCNPFGLFLIDS